jgi:general secretion pathway protein I
LLEVIVALGIVSVGILAVSSAITGYTETTYTLEQRLVANWVGANRLEAIRILGEKPVAGENEGQQEMAGRDWYLQEDVSTTADPLLFRLDIRVYTDEAKTDEASSLTAYLLDEPDLITTGAFAPGGDGQADDGDVDDKADEEDNDEPAEKTPPKAGNQ